MLRHTSIQNHMAGFIMHAMFVNISSQCSNIYTYTLFSFNNNALTRSAHQALTDALGPARCRAEFQEQLKKGDPPLNRSKLVVCGSAFAGKTTLCKALKRSWFESIFTREGKPADFCNIQQHTLCVDITSCKRV